MQFTAKEDIDAPIDAVFEMLTDFEGFERSAMRRGAEVHRVDRLTQPGEGMSWKAAFDLRGRRRDMDVKLVEFVPPTRMAFRGTSTSFTGRFDVDLLALSRTRTRMAVDLEFAAQNLTARLLVQSLKLARSSLTKKFRLRVAEYAKDLEDRHLRSA